MCLLVCVAEIKGDDLGRNDKGRQEGSRFVNRSRTATAEITHRRPSTPSEADDGTRDAL